MKLSDEVNGSYNKSDIKNEGGGTMELTSIMSSQLRDLQQTVRLSVMQNALNTSTTAAAQMLSEMPQSQPTAHPTKGTVIDVSV